MERFLILGNRCVIARKTSRLLPCPAGGSLARVTVLSLLHVIFWNPFSGCATAGEALKLHVAGLKAGEPIPQRFRYPKWPCSGQNLSPEISWESVPMGVGSLAFVVWDQDAPKPGGFYHWMVIGIPRSVRALPEGAGNVMAKRTPPGVVQLINDWGEPGYGGPCPPGGKPHHYRFTLYALKVDRLPVDQKAKAADAITQIKNNSVASSELVLIAGH